MLRFFAAIKKVQENKEPITEDVLRAAIKETTPAMASAHLKFLCSSPKTPDKVTPAPTPSKLISHEKLMELKHTKTQLGNERYERNLLESELKESEDKIELLRKFCVNFNSGSQ